MSRNTGFSNSTNYFDSITNPRKRQSIRRTNNYPSLLRHNLLERRNENKLIGRIYCNNSFGQKCVNDRELHKMFGMYAWTVVYPGSKLRIENRTNMFIVLDPRNNQIIDVLASYY